MTTLRDVAKERTRRSLLDTALRLLDERGEPGLSASAVSREAGIAQSSFYAHFRDKDDLLSALGAEVCRRVRQSARQARQRSREVPTDRERLRATFRLPLESCVAHPAMFRLMLRARHEPASPLGTSARELFAGNRADLVEDLVKLGYPVETTGQRLRVEMIAEGYIALTEAMASAYLDGRCPDLDDVVDMLMVFASGPASLLPNSPLADCREAGAGRPRRGS
jgi:AcrR family transcriptional regulator